MELRFFEKNVYGNDLIYPTPEWAAIFQRLTGQKTAGPGHLESLKKLGFVIIINKANFEITYL